MNINFFLCEEKQFSCGVYSSRFTAKSTESSRTPPLIAYPNSVQARVSLSLCLPTSLTLFARMRRQRAFCTGLLSNRSGSSSCRVGLHATQKWWRCKGSNRMQCHHDPTCRMIDLTAWLWGEMWEWIECDHHFPSEPLEVLIVDQFVGRGGGALKRKKQDSYVYRKTGTMPNASEFSFAFILFEIGR